MIEKCGGSTKPTNDTTQRNRRHIIAGPRGPFVLCHVCILYHEGHTVLHDFAFVPTFWPWVVVPCCPASPQQSCLESQSQTSGTSQPLQHCLCGRHAAKTQLNYFIEMVSWSYIVDSVDNIAWWARTEGECCKSFLAPAFGYANSMCRICR